MRNGLPAFAADAHFRERAARLSALVPKNVRPLDEMFQHLRDFTSVRRREVRVARLEKAERSGAAQWRSHREMVSKAVGAVSTAVKMLSEHASALRPLITPALDDLIVLAVADRHPLRKTLHEIALSLGFAADEVAWLFHEFKSIDYKLVQFVCVEGFEDLEALLTGISIGEGGLLLAGFVRFTGDEETDQRLERIIIRLRERGVTASLFLALVIIITAHLVATQDAANSSQELPPSA